MEKVFDIHMHYLRKVPLEELIDTFKMEFEATATAKGAFLGCCQEENDPEFEPLHNIKGLYLKQAFAPDFYAYASLEHPIDHSDVKAVGDDFLAQTEKYMAMGYDGMKMLEGYPSLMKIWGFVPVDSPIYDKYYAFMEENGFPITLHIANPTENWDITKASPSAIAARRVYDGTYPKKDEITAQTFNVMKKFPKLKLMLAHMGFFSMEKENAERFLGDYENTSFDIAPGGEQLLNMLKDWDYWLRFIEKYSDRVYYGTDLDVVPNGAPDQYIRFMRRPMLIRNLFETTDEHTYYDDVYRGVKLDAKLRRKIYYDNAERLLGEPKKIDRKMLAAELDRVTALKRQISPTASVDLAFMASKLQGGFFGN